MTSIAGPGSYSDYNSIVRDRPDLLPPPNSLGNNGKASLASPNPQLAPQDVNDSSSPASSEFEPTNSGIQFPQNPLRNRISNQSEAERIALAQRITQMPLGGGQAGQALQQVSEIHDQVRILAEDESAAVRQALVADREPNFRVPEAVIDTLTQDPDPDVREAAQEIKAKTVEQREVAQRESAARTEVKNKLTEMYGTDPRTIGERGIGIGNSRVTLPAPDPRQSPNYAVWQEISPGPIMDTLVEAQLNGETIDYERVQSLIAQQIAERFSPQQP